MKRWSSTLLFTFLAAAVVLGGAGCRGGSRAANQALTEQVTLDWWRVFDGHDSFRELIDQYEAIHPNIRVNYRRLRFEEYEDELIQAFAEGRAPDIISIHNTWIPEYQALTQPLPDSLQIVFIEERGNLKKEKVPVIQEVPTITERQLRSQFVDVVATDVIRPYQPDPATPAQNRIWGLPMSVDTLSMYYNRDLLNAAGIAEPPETWRDFQNAVKLMTRVDQQGNIIQAGAAIGTARNVERAPDILSAIMMQNGTQMSVDRNGVAVFAEAPEGSLSRTDIPSTSALQFYTDFANPVKEVYTWNEDQPSSFEAFANGTTGFFFGYSYHAPLLEARNPKLNFEVGKLPQISEGRVVNFANYWVEMVSKDTEHLDESWEFIQFVTDEERVGTYLDKAQKPTALRGLINTQIEDLRLSAPVSQVLTAQSWYRGRDAQAMEEAFLEMIEAAPTAEKLADIIRIAQNKVNQTL